MWCLHRTSRWPAGAVLRRRRRGGLPFRDHHHRRAVARRQPPLPVGVGRARRSPVRFLPARPNHDRRRTPRAQPQSQRRRHRQGDARQHLPLRHLSAHSRCHQGSGETPMPRITTAPRRDFLHRLGVGTGALVLGYSLSSEAFGLDLPSPSELIHGIPVPDVPFVALKLNGDVVIITHRAEMGQGIRASLAAVLADELEADWKRVTLRQANADSTKFGVPFPYPVPPETKLPYPYNRARPDKPRFVLDADAAPVT